MIQITKPAGPGHDLAGGWRTQTAVTPPVDLQ
jgi:hypothetical protein